jgi:Ca2+-binding RTX toxin-like protein
MAVIVRSQLQNNSNNVNEAGSPPLNNIFVTRTATFPDTIGTPLTVRFNLTGVSIPATGTDFTVGVLDGVNQNPNFSGSDFLNNGIIIPANISTVTVNFTVVDDTLFEDSTPEVLSIDLVPTASYVLDPGFLNTLNVGQIVDNELAPTISIAAAGTTFLFENSGNFPFVITQSVASALPTTFTFTITPSGVGIAAATAGQDYTNITGTFTIPAGQTSTAVSIPILEDTIFEPNQSFSITISSPVNATLGATTTATVTIQDNDAAPIIGINSPAAVLEGSPVNFTVGFTGLTTATEFGAVTGTINTADVTAVAGADYTPISQAFSIPALSTSVTVPFTTLVDTITEPTETFTATLSGIAGGGGGSVTNGTLVGTGTILDNNPVNVSITAGTPNPITEGTGINPIVSFTATLGTNITTATIYNVVLIGAGANPAIIGTAVNTPAGTDAFPTVGQITFPANSLAGVTQNFTATIVGDAVSEPSELFTVQLQPVANGLTLSNSNAPTVTILDDDSIVNITATLPNASEAGVPGRFTIARNTVAGDLTVNYTVGGTASNGGVNADFIPLLIGTAVIPSASNSVDVNILPVADALVEGSETLVLTLAAGAGYTLGANTVAIVNIADLVNNAPGGGTFIRRDTATGSLLLGSNNDDAGVGTILNDSIAGFAGNDLIFGLAGNDSLSGGFSNDTLVGGAGNDTLLGGIGADTFRFILPTDGIDTIQDFTLSDNDRIEISAVGFGGGLVAGALPGGAFGYNSVTGALSINGTQIATLINTPAITTANIFVI